MRHLPLRERLFVLIIASLLLFLTALSHYHDSSDPYAQEITVTIQGAVARPGSYTFTHTASLLDLDLIAGFLPNANRRGLKNRLCDLPRAEILLTTTGSKAIFLKGAVKLEGYIVVKETARIKDLKATGMLRDDADPQWLKRKRLLKNLEEVIVPSTNQK